MKTSEALPGSPENPIEISDRSEARANVCYIIKPKPKVRAPKETANGEAV